MKSFGQLIFVLSILAMVVSCGGDISGSGKGDLSVSITDAPVQNADAVVIYIEEALVHSSEDGNVVIDILDPESGLRGRSIDLLQLTGDRSIELFNHTFSEGTISWIRLDVDFDPLKTYIEINETRYPLRCTSCENNGLKLNNSFEVIADSTMAYTLDFDLQKSITDPQSSIDYKLRPTIRIVETNTVGSIRGTVDESLIANLGGFTGCSVYVYDGHNVVTDDIYLPPTNYDIPESYNNPVMATPVKLNSSGSLYEYHSAFLPAGYYTIALTCDAESDDPEIDDNSLTFFGTANKSVSQGQVTTHDFLTSVTLL